MEFGMTVKIKWSESCPYRQYGHTQETYHNVTEVHYNYPEGAAQRVAFESDIHGTGITQPISYIQEMEIRPASEKAAEF